MLFLNQVIEDATSKKRFRILKIDASMHKIWIIQINESLALPICIDEITIEDSISSGNLLPVESNVVASLRKPTEKALSRRDKAYEQILPLIQSPLILNAEFRGEMVKERAAELRCSEQTIYKYLRCWWRNGQSINALLPNFHKIGSAKGNTAGRGRPVIFGKYSTYQLGPQDYENMTQIIKKNFLKNKNCTVRNAHIILLERFYSYIDAEGELTIKAEGEFPSITQFRYFLNQNYSKETQIRSRFGDIKFELENRAKLGSLRNATYTVGELYEIDATVVDVMLVFSKNRAKVIGKPTLYIVRDRKSNLITGFNVGLEGANWSAAMQAIKSISEDKRTLCNSYNVKYDAKDWPAHQVFPQSICADRGSEMMGKNSTRLAESLEVTITNLPSRRADWKPHVECGFKQMLRPIASDIPGYTPPEEFGKRQVRDPAQDAVMTLNEFKKLILEKIILTNNKPLSNNPLSPKDVLDRIIPSPINIWNLEIRERAGLLTRYSEDEVLFALLPQRKATVTREGIQIGLCFYSAPEAIKNGWFVDAGNGRFSVIASYDNRLVDSIYIHDKNQANGYFVARLLEKSEMYAGLSFTEVEAIAYQRKLDNKDFMQLSRQLDVNFRTKTQPMLNSAIEETKKAITGKNRKTRKKDIVGTRNEERKTQRQSEAQLDNTKMELTAEIIDSSNKTNSNKPKSVFSSLKDIIDGI